MTEKQRKIIHKYKNLTKEEIEKTILKIIKINDQILFDSNILELCEYLYKLEEVFGEIKKVQIKL
jgi:hypothetical protein